jgi:hypothetical protein
MHKDECEHENGQEYEQEYMQGYEQNYEQQYKITNNSGSNSTGVSINRIFGEIVQSLKITALTL